MPNQAREAIEDARAKIEHLAREFVDEAVPIVERALQRSVDRYVEGHPGDLARLDDRLLEAFRAAIDRAVQRGTKQVASRLERRDLWLSPTVLRGEASRPDAELDRLNNRVWVALLNAADELDPVMEEFGFRPNRGSDLGGAHFGLQPQTLEDLDPTGKLSAVWRRYVQAFDRYVEAVGHARTARLRSVLDRWRRVRTR